VQEATDALSKLEQSPEPKTPKQLQAMKKREHTLKPLIHAVLSCGLLLHQDNHVKLALAICITELFRVKAPQPPFQDNHLRVPTYLFIIMHAYVTLIETRVCDSEGFFDFRMYLNSLLVCLRI
jgi:sister-chromatid-cohesion protein PDS5